LEIKPTKTGGHLLLKLDSTSTPIFVPRDSGAGDVQRRVNVGDRIRVRGTATEFGGKEELKVGRAADIEVL
jgi:predicted extracellular nuclease